MPSSLLECCFTPNWALFWTPVGTGFFLPCILSLSFAAAAVGAGFFFFSRVCNRATRLPRCRGTEFGFRTRLQLGASAVAPAKTLVDRASKTRAPYLALVGKGGRAAVRKKWPMPGARVRGMCQALDKLGRCFSWSFFASRIASAMTDNVHYASRCRYCAPTPLSCSQPRIRGAAAKACLSPSVNLHLFPQPHLAPHPRRRKSSSSFLFL